MSYIIRHSNGWESVVFFCTVTAFVHPPGPCPAQPLWSMSTAHSSHSNSLVAHSCSRLPLWRLSATVQKILCFYASSIQVPQTCSCVKLMVVTLLFLFFIEIIEPHFEGGLYPPNSAHRFSTEYCANIVGWKLGTNSLTYYLDIIGTCFIDLFFFRLDNGKQIHSIPAN